jgi:serine/threonine protein kinase
MQLGSCEILGRIGAGGMGEVFRGRDTKLGRDVAVKALPDAFAHDANRMVRFEREAQVLAALNHPNLAVIHELKEIGGSRYLILELVEGETLAERIARGPLPLDDALTLARQIAEGVEAAHEKGIIHRDLKPANVKVTPEGRVKVLDFGLAKIYESSTATQNFANSPTISAMQTGAGVILGTVAYMSPEQARGKDVDRRADIWAFGCVLYEMLTGHQAFPTGQTVSDTIASILAREPDWQALPATTPSRVRALIERCLRKDERRRWGYMADVRVELEEARTERETHAIAIATPKSSRRPERLLALAALVFFLTSVGGLLWQTMARRPDTRPLEMEMIGPPGATLSSLRQAQISPDGRRMAFIITFENKRMIWVRQLDATPQSLTSTEGAGEAFFWSPDSEYIAFIAEGKLKKVAAAGGPSQVVATLPAGGAFEGTWNNNQVILLGSETTPGGPLLRVAPASGTPAPATKLDAAKKETAHAYPHFLPDGKHFFYVARSSNPENAFAAYVGQLDSEERHPLPGIASEVLYSPTGDVVFIRDGALMAQPFDVKSLMLSGDATPVADAFVPPRTVEGDFSVSDDGRLAYFRAANLGGASGNSQLSWRERTGQPAGTAGPEGEYGRPELSPTGKFVAFSRGTPGNIWILDIEKNLAEPLTNDPADDRDPRWARDEKTIVFQSNRDGSDNFYQRAVGVVGEDKLLFKDDKTKVLSDWSRDEKYLVYTADGDVWALPMPTASGSGEAKPRQITQTPAMETAPRISPDGRWIAYASDEPGQSDVYVQSFPDPGFRQKVSTQGGTLPRWNPDGKELFYRDNGVGGWMTVAMTFSGASFTAKAPVRVFGAPITTPIYSVAAGGRFLIQQPPGTGGRGARGAGLPSFDRIVVLLHWGKRKD